MNWLALLIATTFFTGFLPGKIIGKSGSGGGLIGSIVGFAIQILIISYGGSIAIALWAVLISFLLGIVTIDKAEKFMVARWGAMKRHNGEIANHDFNQTNIDEVHGQLIAGLPVFVVIIPNFYFQVLILLMSIIFFRIFDVLKPWPIKNIEKSIKGSYGIMLDDTIAGIIAALFSLLIAAIII